MTNMPQIQGPHCAKYNEIVKKEENGKIPSIHQTHTAYKYKMQI